MLQQEKLSHSIDSGVFFLVWMIRSLFSLFLSSVHSCRPSVSPAFIYRLKTWRGGDRGKGREGSDTERSHSPSLFSLLPWLLIFTFPLHSAVFLSVWTVFLQMWRVTLPEHSRFSLSFPATGFTVFLLFTAAKIFFIYVWNQKKKTTQHWLLWCSQRDRNGDEVVWGICYYKYFGFELLERQAFES